KRPYVAGRREPSARGLGCVIDAGFATADGFVNPLEPVGRELDLIGDGHDVGRLQVTQHKSLAVNTSKRVEDGDEHVARFLSAQRPLRKNLREIFLRI